MKPQRLCDVLKLRPTKKWAVLQEVAASRDGSLLDELSMKDKSDCATVAQLMKLVLAEQKKHEHEHVVTLMRAIRWCFLDHEAVFGALVKGGLARCILATIKELREKAADGIEGKAPTLQLLLANISDMFEWDFFGDGDYNRFVEEMLLILTSCNDCDGSLYAEAACVLMSMCSTSTDAVCKCLVESKKCASLMEKMMYELPRAKSFFYEALLLELAYRIQRHGKKKQDEHVARIAAKLIDAFPVQVARSLPGIHPKKFREETRQILNEFNLGVGVIKSFKLLKLQCPQLSKSKICMEPTGWIDLGGATLEIEVTAGVGDQGSSSTLKLPYKHVKSVVSKDSLSQIVLFVNDTISLAEVVEGINDQTWSKINGFSLVLHLVHGTHTNVKDFLDQRLGTRKEGKMVMIESRTIKQEAIEAVVDSRPTEMVQDPKPVKQRSRQRPPKKVTQNAEPEKLQSTERVEAEAANQLRKRLRGETQRDLAKTVVKKKKIAEIRDDPESTSALEPRVVVRQSARPIKEKPSTQIKPSVVYHSPSPVKPTKLKASKRVSAQSVRARTSSSSEDLSPTPNDEDAAIVPDDEDVAQERPTRRKQSFRDAQSQQFRRLQALVEDIVKTNDEYREFNIASLCYNVAVQSETLLTRKRRDREETDHFVTTSCALDESEATRGSERSRRKDMQHTMEQVVADASSSEVKLIESTKTILTTIDTAVASEWRQDLERVHKKLRTHASQSVAQAKQKLGAIEKTFNTDDLRVMQQMMQRI